MRNAIDINVDMGESFGRWSSATTPGSPFISSASIACGYHAGDPRTMRKTVALAVEHGVYIGAHVALPDLLGFGRRRMTVSPADLTDYCTFQIGALAAFVRSRALRLVREGKLTKTDGGDLEVDVSTFCLHGDAPNAVDVARAVRARLEEAGIAIRPLSELVEERAAG
jgi:lactam utilization protein B